MDPIRRLAKRIASVEKLAFRAATQPQLAHAAVEDGAIRVVENGSIKAIIGQQHDGTTAVTTVNGPTPPQPSNPNLIAVVEGVTIRWDGLFSNGQLVPMDFARIEIHASTDPTVSGLLAETIVGTIETPRGGEHFVSAVGGVPVYVRLVTRSTTGARSIASEIITTTPQSVADIVVDPTPTTVPETSPDLLITPYSIGFMLRSDDVDRYSRIEYHVSTSSGFTPGPSTLIDTTESQMLDTRIDPSTGVRYSAGVTYFFKTVAVNNIGPSNNPGVEMSAQLEKVSGFDVADLSLTAVKFKTNTHVLY